MTPFPGMDFSSLQALAQQFGPTEEDKRQARAMAALTAAAGLLGTRRGYEAQGISQGLLGGLGAYQNDLRSLQQQKMQGLQGAAAMMDLQAKNQAYQDQQRIRALAPQFATPAQPGMPEMGPPTAQGEMQPAVAPKPAGMDFRGYQNALFGINPSLALQLQPQVDQQAIREARTRGGVPSVVPGGVPPGGLPQAPVSPVQQFIQRSRAQAQALRDAGYPAEADKLEADALKLMPKSKASVIVGTDPKTGRLAQFSQDDQGNLTPLPIGVKPDMRQVDNGSSIGFVDANSPTIGSTVIPKTMAPGQAASNAIALENLKLRKLEVDPFGMLSGNGQTPAITETTNGDEFLKTLPKPLGDQVKALAEGRMAFPAGFALKSPYWQKMISMVSQYDPSFDAVNYTARSKTRSDFTAGKSAQQINALNTVIGHLGQLSDAADSLNNTSIPLINQATNFVRSQTGDPRVKTFDITRKAVVDELTRVYRGTGGSEKDIETWTKAINDANSPEQLHSAIAQIGGLLESKIQAFHDQYTKGMGTTSQGMELLTPHARTALDTMEKRGGKKSDSGPITIQSDDEFAQLPSGTEFIGPDGKRRRKP